MPHAAPAPGTVLLGKYRVERELGSGGMGVVVEATHVALEQRVAIKVLGDRFAGSPEMTARFLREARIAAKIQSDHVARVSDVGQTETGAPYIVMELLVGHDLEAEITQRVRLPVSEAVDLVLQACEGIAHAHAAGLVHRDLKPANLFLARRPNRPPIVKVLDFGLSKEAQGGSGMSLTGDDSVFGTPQYMSPEQVHSAKNVDARSDQHALGMILFELITGQPPYVAETVTALVVVIATHPPPSARVSRAEVPRGLDQAIVRALAKRPGDRFADLADFAEAIAPFGGPSAREMAEAIRASLTSRYSIDPDVPRRSSAPNAPSDQLITAPIGAQVVRTGLAHTHSALTSSVDFGRRTRRGQRVAIAGGAAAIAIVAICIGVFAMTGGPSSDPVAAGAGAGTDAKPADAPAPVAPPPSSEPGPAVSAAGAPSSVPVVTASSSAGKRVKPVVSKTVKTTPQTSASSVIGVFGERTPK